MKRGILDIGNTAVKWAVFNDLEMLDQGRMDGHADDYRQLAENHGDLNWYWSSTRDDGDLAVSLLGAQEILLEEPLPVTIAYRTPSTLGRDRLAAVCGAHQLFPKSPCLVIDAGTCITFDLVDAAGNYPGGSISPGLNIRLKAMHTFTGKLPLQEWEDPEDFIGDSTRNSMLQGVKQGLIGEAERQIRLYEARYPDLRILLSGGDSGFFEKHLKKDIFAAPYLVLIGLNAIQHYKN